MAIERAILYGSIADLVQIRNMFTCEVIESGGDTSAILWEAYMSSLNDALEPISSTVVHFYQYIVEELTAGSWVGKDVVEIDVNGTAADDPLPYQMALVLIGKAVGKRLMGRKFIAGLTETLNIGGLTSVGVGTYAAALLLAYLAPFEGIGGGTITPGIVDKAGNFHPFVSGYVNSLLGTMRRRKPGVGI